MLSEVKSDRKKHLHQNKTKLLEKSIRLIFARGKVERALEEGGKKIQIFSIR